ncbi:MAG: hypothetical protein ACI4F1_02350 [Bariatricus sp.]
MMNEWLIKFFMKSGKEIRVIYCSDADNSDKVAREVFRAKNPKISFNGRENVFVILGEVEAFSIQPWYSEKN